MFVDQVKIFVKGGDGGNGCVSFRREAHVPRGGPDGGVGGKGGDVVLVAVSHQNTLLPLRYQPEHRADRGGHGGPGNRTGRDGAERTVSVPPGTVRARRGDRGAARRGAARRGPPRGRARRAGGPRQPLLPLEPQPRPARGRARAAGRGAVAAARPAAHRRRGPPRPAERRQVDAPRRASRRRAPRWPTTPSRRSPPCSGWSRPTSGPSWPRTSPASSRGRTRGPGSACSSSATSSAPASSLHVVDASGLSGRDPADDLALVREEVRRYAPALLERPQLVAATQARPRRRRRPAARRSGGPRPSWASRWCRCRRPPGTGSWRSSAGCSGLIAASRAAPPLEERA